MSALNAAAKEKLLQDPNWKPPAMSPEKKERYFMFAAQAMSMLGSLHKYAR